MSTIKLKDMLCESRSYYGGNINYIITELIYDTRPDFKFWSNLYIEYNDKSYEGKKALQLLLGLSTTKDIYKLEGSTEQSHFILTKK